MDVSLQSKSIQNIRKTPCFQSRLAILFICLLLSSFSVFASVNSLPPISEVFLSEIDAEGCCFQLNYNYDGALGAIDAIETRILTPNVLFSSVQFSLGNGWSYDELLTQRRLRWEHNNANIPLGQQTLSDLCFSGWNTSNPVVLLVIWRQGNAVRQRDTIQIECTQCWRTQNPIVNCEADSSYTYTFDYENLSEFRVDYLQIRELDDEDLIIEENIQLAEALQAGETRTALQIHIRSSAVAYDELCFEITPRHITHDSIVIECCTAEYCVPIPDCDRCCTDYSIFDEEVNQGFSMSLDCDNMRVRLQANALNECDQVRFEIMGLGAGIVAGDEAVIFGGLLEDTIYQVCMTATRRDMDGVNCYEDNSLEICDQFTFDCLPDAVNDIKLLQGGRLWPNPTSQNIHIELPIQGQCFFEVWNGMGQSVFQSETNTQGEAQISSSQWPAGYYFITAYVDRGTLWRMPFIVKKGDF